MKVCYHQIYSMFPVFWFKGKVGRRGWVYFYTNLDFIAFSAWKWLDIAEWIYCLTSNKNTFFIYHDMKLLIMQNSEMYSKCYFVVPLKYCKTTFQLWLSHYIDIHIMKWQGHHLNPHHNLIMDASDAMTSTMTGNLPYHVRSWMSY